MSCLNFHHWAVSSFPVLSYTVRLLFIKSTDKEPLLQVLYGHRLKGSTKAGTNLAVSYLPSAE